VVLGRITKAVVVVVNASNDAIRETRRSSSDRSLMMPMIDTETIEGMVVGCACGF
jgi:hypothetical protein